MGFIERTRQRSSTVGELFQFLWQRKMFWMIPMVVVMILFGVILVISQGSAIAPFIYTLF